MAGHLEQAFAGEPPSPEDIDHRTKTILQRQIDGLPPLSPKESTVFALAEPIDLVFLAISTISAVIAGALNPLLTVVYALLVRSFQDHADGNNSGRQLSTNIAKFALYNVYLGIAEFVFIYIATVGFYHSGERITRNLRRAYLKAIIRQNIAFFDHLGAGEVTTRITVDMNIIQEGITSKIALFLTALATFLSAVVISFIAYWKLALILLSTVFLLGGAEFLGALFALKYNRENSTSLGKGSSVVEEALSSIRHVSAFGLKEVMVERYNVFLSTAEKWGVKTRLATAIMIGAMNTIPYLSYAMAFWQGSRYIVSGEMTASQVVMTTMATIIGAFAVGRVAPNAESFVGSITHAGAILKAISRRSPIDPLSNEGQKLLAVKGDFELQNVTMAYPGRQNIKVLKNVSLRLPANKTTALVGASGSGKSSIIGLFERFYEPTGGLITLDGHDIAELNVNWLRQQMAYVGQEPVLLNRSIFENIRLGLHDSIIPRPDNEIQELVHSAARIAYAHDFIMALPMGYQTEVGAKGLQLSGGQRQRICIARAVISNPKILLLDEATSALDVKSERAVQLALETASQDRTTIVIAHRLSTVRNADNIVVLSHGSVVEQGRHTELIALGGAYSTLVESQHIGPSPEDDAAHLADSVGDPIGPSKEQTESKMDTINSEIELEKRQDLSEETSVIPSEIKPTFWTYILVTARLNEKEIGLISLGLLLCILAGFIVPAQAVFFAESITTVSLPVSQYAKLRHDVNFWSLMFLMVAFVAFIAWVGQGICFAYSTERLTCNARHKTFRHILRQDIGFFDQKEHSSGALTSFLSTAATDLTGLSGAIIGACITFITTLVAAIVLSLVIGWKLALVCSAMIPIMTGCGYVRLRMLALFDSEMRKTHEAAAIYASEIISVIRSVATLSLEDHVLLEYGSILSREASKTLRSILRASALYAASQSLSFFCAALAFWYGGKLLATKEYQVLQFYICFTALISGAQIAGAVFSYAPDMSKALHASRDLKPLFESKPKIDTCDATGQHFPKAIGQIDLVNVSFRYPSRPERLVLDKFTAHIRPGQYIALVGPSGSGKSTVIQLLERFFDPSEGVEGAVREERLIQVCKEANIYDFIASLPDGWSTTIGSAGAMLSGGQKQRIAIARALPTPILLLDEATSALDSESERAVQVALDRASKGRTTIAVAHRLSTIQHADLIYVIDQGRVVEKGSHAELMSKGGMYYGLVQVQSLSPVAS